MNQPDFNLVASMKQLQSGEIQLDQLPEVLVEKITARYKLDAEALQKRFDSRIEKERSSPIPGSKAPDFSLPLIDAQGNYSGETRSLRDSLDKPVALIFGSYT